LAEDQRSRLFQWLDEEPGRWRRCALTLLEAQVWGEACELLNRAAPPPADIRSPPRSAHHAQRRLSKRGVFGFAVAAFLVGLLVGHWSLLNQEFEPRLVDLDRNRPNTAESIPAAKTVATSASREPQGRSPLPLTPTSSLTIRTDGEQDIQLPIVDCPAMVKDLVERPTPLPDSIVSQWARRGYRLRQNLLLVPVEVDGGKKLVIPVEQYQPRFVGGGSS
jgi:hypothetical protein